MLVVTERETDTGSVLETVAPATPAMVPVQPGRRRRWLIPGLLALVLFACLAIAWAVAHRVSTDSADPSHPLWASLFDKSRPTLIVPSDDGIVMIPNLTGHRSVVGITIATICLSRAPTTSMSKT